MYKLDRDDDREEDVREEELKKDLLVNNPELYNSLFGEKSKYLDEEEIEYVQPESDADFNKLMRELKEIGAIS